MNIFINGKAATAGDCLELENGENGNIKSIYYFLGDMHINLKPYYEAYIIYKAEDYYKLPLACLPTLRDVAKFVKSDRNTSRYYMLNGQPLHGFQIEKIKIFED